MARDEAESGRGEASLFDRRTYLKLTGASLASAVATGATATSAAAAETITVPAGETKSISVGSGETFENTVIDQSADGAQASIVATGSDWTIRNVGFKGKSVGHGDGSFYQILPSVSSGSTGTIENVYLGNGCEKVDGETGYAGGIWVQDEHAGTLTIRNCNLQRFSNNGIYASGPGVSGHSQGKGTVQVESCYVANCDIANVRLGTPGSYMADSVIEVTGKGPQNRNGPNRRGFWGWYADLEIRNSDISVSGSGTGYAVHGGFHGGSVAVKNSAVSGGTTDAVTTTNVSSNPETSVPAGVPTKPAQAANGGGKRGGGGGNGDNGGDGSDGGDGGGNGDSGGNGGNGGNDGSGGNGSSTSDLPRTVTVTGGSPGSPASYRISVSGRIADGDGNGAPVESEDEVGKSTVRGFVVGQSDRYQFSGSLDELDVADGASAIVMDTK